MESPARAKMTQYGLDHALPEGQFYTTLTTAVEAYRAQSGQDWQAPTEAAPRTDDQLGDRPSTVNTNENYPVRVRRDRRAARMLASRALRPTCASRRTHDASFWDG